VRAAETEDYDDGERLCEAAEMEAAAAEEAAEKEATNAAT
jgi:hypothetical protein